MADFATILALPDVDFVSTSVDDLLAAAISAYEQAYLERTGQQVTVQPGDDVYIILYAQALRDYSILQTINYAARQNLLKYSAGTNLDQLAANTGNVRAQPQPAVTSLTFTLGAAQPAPVTIPQGTRVTAGDGVYFATDEIATIPAGSMSVEVSATCMTAGAVGNGYIPGQMKTIVDSVAYVQSVTNTETTVGGSDLQTDRSLAEQIFASPSGFSVAGPAGAYDYFTRRFSSAVIDTAIIQTAPGELSLYVLLAGGVLPNETFLSELAAYLEPYRPLTDELTCLAPTVQNYDINLTYYIDPANAGQAATIQTAVAAAVADFETSTKSRIGRDVIPDQLTAAIINAGAKRVTMTSPAFTKVDAPAVAIAQNITATYGGIDGA